MDNSNSETLIFPPYRRRPLRSQTFQSLLQFLSILDDHPHFSDSGVPESEVASKTDGYFAHPKVACDELLCQNDPLTDENIGVSGMQDGNHDNTQGEIVGSDQISKNKELPHVDDTNLMKSLGNENRDSSLLMSNLEEQSIVPRVLRIEELTHEKCYDVTTSLDEDKMVNISQSVNNNKNYRPVDMIALEEDNDHIQGTWMALDKPTLASGAIDSPLIADREAEEGEISGESLGLSPEDDILSKGKRGNEEHFPENVSGKEQKIGLDKDGRSNPWSEDITCNLSKRVGSEIREPNRNLVEYNSEIFTHGTFTKSSKLNGYRCKPKTGETNRQKGEAKESDSAGVCLKKDTDIPSKRKRQTSQAKEKRANKKICTSKDKFDSVVPGKPIDPLNTQGYFINLESVRKENQSSGVNNSGDPEVCPENLPSVGVLPAETLSQNKENASPEKGDDVPEKKTKRVLTKERKAKKKQKAKMKLAEKNGRPAVKRMQLQPVAKQKSVCRHYLYGRCKEGAQCKFSHDTVPLTKSTPCSHFARHSCMKGDQCPFDHELSKYPCNNFQTKGSCSRGADCMFSHKMQGSEGASSSAVKATGPDLLALSLLNNSSSLNRFIVNEKLDGKSSSISLSPSKNTQHKLAVTTPKPSPLAPKGTVVHQNLLHWHPALALEQDTASPIGTMATPKSTALAPKGATMASLMGTGATPKSTALTPKRAMATHKPSNTAPKGMSFLSHGNLLPDAGSTPKADVGVKVDHQLTPNSISVQNNSESTKKIHAVAPRGINFLAFGKKSLMDVSNPSSPLKKNDGIGKSSLSNFCEGEKSYPSLKKDDGVKVDNHVNKSQPDGFSSKTQVDFQKRILPKTPMSLQNVLKSTLSFASKFESEVKIGSPVVRRDLNKEAGSSSNSSTKAPSILDLIYGSRSKTL